MALGNIQPALATGRCPHAGLLAGHGQLPDRRGRQWSFVRGRRPHRSGLLAAAGCGADCLPAAFWHLLADHSGPQGPQGPRAHAGQALSQGLQP